MHIFISFGSSHNELYDQSYTHTPTRSVASLSIENCTYKSRLFFSSFFVTIPHYFKAQDRVGSDPEAMQCCQAD